MTSTLLARGAVQNPSNAPGHSGGTTAWVIAVVIAVVILGYVAFRFLRARK